MNSAHILYERFGITSEMDIFGRIRFSGVGRCVPVVSGDSAAWEEIRQLMIDVEKNGRKYLQKDNRLIVTGERQTLVLYPSEVRSLLKMNPDLWFTAIRRGKGLRRTVANEGRRNG